MHSKLHTELHFSNGRISKNRFALAPMTNSQSLVNGKLGHKEFLWLKQFAQGGFGMVITCAAHVSLEGQGWENELGIFNDQCIESLKVLTSTLKYYNTLSVIQIYHGGLRSPTEVLKHPPLDLNDLSEQKIESIIQEYVNAAARAEKAGFDGVEIHGANGYLITQFISRQTNFRTDEYGISLENRARFYKRIVSECRRKVSKNFIVGVRLSPENFGIQTGLDFEENLTIGKWLAEEGADYFHISTWDAFRPHLLDGFRKALPHNFPIIIAGGLTSIEACLKILHAGASMVALGKIAIGNPYFPIRSQNPNYIPNFPPFAEEYLKKCNVTESFYKLLYNFPNFLVT